MKCPKCGYEYIYKTNEINEWAFRNLIIPLFLFVLGCGWLLPFDMDHGYSTNFDLIIGLGLVLLYGIYLWLYAKGKVKGTFVFIKKEATK